jgi:hypothetical protein
VEGQNWKGLVEGHEKLETKRNWKVQAKGLVEGHNWQSLVEGHNWQSLVEGHEKLETKRNWKVQAKGLVQRDNWMEPANDACGQHFVVQRWHSCQTLPAV